MPAPCCAPGHSPYCLARSNKSLSFNQFVKAGWRGLHGKDLVSTRVQFRQGSASREARKRHSLALFATLPRILGEAEADSGLVERRRHELPDGTGLEVLCSIPKGRATKNFPIVFIHGSGRAAWCWQEFMSFFSGRGYSCYALSLRGQGNGDRQPGSKGNTLGGTAVDIADFIASLAQPPVVVAHSFGGLAMQRYLQEAGPGQRFPAIRGLALLCSAPPSGNAKLIKRMFARSWKDALRLTWAFVTKSYTRDAGEAKWAFLAADSPPDITAWFAGKLKEFDSPVPVIDVQRLSKEMPLVEKPTAEVPVLVLGGEEDIVVDLEGLRETADFYGVEPVILPAAAHDLMLDLRWEEAARVLDGWLDSLSD